MSGSSRTGPEPTFSAGWWYGGWCGHLLHSGFEVLGASDLTKWSFIAYGFVLILITLSVLFTNLLRIHVQINSANNSSLFLDNVTFQATAEQTQKATQVFPDVDTHGHVKYDIYKPPMNGNPHRIYNIT